MAALDVADEQQRQAFLEQACAGDAEQRYEIQRLLAAHDSRDANPVDRAMMQLSPAETCGLEADASVEFDISDHPTIDRYKLLEQIGEGGMGTVFMAQQTQPIKRKVALKLVKLGMNRRDVIARFEAERQTLALMEHANIARVLDAGTTAGGQPYFVMELVRGIPITKYCDQKCLSIEDRLRLFIDVCRAVQHAHQKGIIHRDLKPSNVMVTLHDGVPVVKVIDFGVAKALNQDQELSEPTLFTQFAQMIGTPLYMSPEQAEMSGLDVDTRSDVYSLGVLLYELLTGTLPFDKETLAKAGFDGMRRIICEEEPSRPSHKISTLEAHLLSTVSSRRNADPRQLSMSMRRELDWIVMKALEKDRNRRYESASAFATDIERYLSNERVIACPPSTAYVLHKFAIRNRGLVTAASVVALLILIAAGLLWNERSRTLAALGGETIQREKAEKNLKLANAQTAAAEANMKAAMDAVERLLANVSNPQLANVPALQETWASILEESIKFYQRFRVNSGSSPEVDYRAAKVFLQFGHLMTVTKPDSDQVIDNYERGLGLAKNIVFQQPQRDDYRELLAELHLACADYHWMPPLLATEQHDARTEQHFESAEQHYAHLALKNPGNHDYAKKQGYVLSRMANFVWKRSPDDPRVEQFVQLATDLGYQVPLHARARHVSKRDQRLSAQYWRKAIAFHRSHPDYNENPTGSPSIDNLWWGPLAADAIKDESPEETEWVLQTAIKENHESHKDFPSHRGYRHHIDHASICYFNFLLRTGGHQEALNKVDDLIQEHGAFHFLRSRIIKEWPDPDRQWQLLTNSIERFPSQVDYYRVRAEVLEDRHEFDLALDDFNRVLELKENHQYALLRRGMLHGRLGNHQKAVDDYTRWFSMVGGLDHDRHIYERRAAAHFELGNFSDALADLKRAADFRPTELSSLTWIDHSKIAACPDPDFRMGMLELADAAVQRADGGNARIYRALLLAAFGESERAQIDLDRAVELEPKSKSVSDLRIHFFASQGRWQDLRQELAKNVELEPGYYNLYQSALVALSLKDADDYRRLCDRMLQDFQDSDNPLETNFVAWSCALAAGALKDYTPAIKLARQAVENQDVNQHYLNSLGAMLFRAGEYAEAQTQLEAALQVADSEKTSAAYSQFFLAMTQHHLDQYEEAASTLAQANQMAEQELNDPASPPAWNRRLTLQLLRKEAESMLAPSPTAATSNQQIVD